MKKIALILLLSLVLSACSAGSKRNESASAPMTMSGGQTMTAYDNNQKNTVENELYYSERSYEAGAPPAAEAYTSGEADTTVREEKKIITGNMTMDTNRFDYVFDKMREITVSMGGYVQSSDSYYYSWNSTRQNNLKAGNMTLRIPAENYEEVKKQIESLGKVNSVNEYTDDATAVYYDTEARLIRKQAEEQRLLDMISEAKKLEDLIELEKRLAEVRTDIEIYQSRMLNIDRLSAYSTLNVSLTEVSDEVLTLVSEDLPSRIRNSFIKSFNSTVAFFENVIIFMAGAIVPLSLVAVAMFIVIMITRRVIKKTQKIE